MHIRTVSKVYKAAYCNVTEIPLPETLQMESTSIPTFGSTTPYLNFWFNDDNQGLKLVFDF
jgi:hypothetical protein